MEFALAMPSWLAELLKLLGFTTSFVYAAATYGAFHWLDKKASGPAKKAMRGWIRSDLKIDTTNIVIGMFDRIYAFPLLRWQSLRRSVAITILICTLFWLEEGMFKRWIESEDPAFTWSIVAFAYFFNCLSDYASLFAVRGSLLLAKERPIISLLLGSLAGALVVSVLFLIRASAFVAAVDVYEGALPSLGSIGAVTSSNFWYLPQAWFNDRTLSAALAVHLWLPLFGVATLIVQAITWFSRAVGWMQWFLRHGQHHPFQAVGYVASAIVFVGSVAIQYVWR
jgi:hypothetical protein